MYRAWSALLPRCCTAAARCRLHTSAAPRLPLTINMPALSPTMEMGAIVKWNKKEGDEIDAGDVLCEIQTDKAVVAMEADEEGTLAKILAAEGTPDIPVGRPIAVIAEPDEDWKEVQSTAKEPSAETSSPTKQPDSHESAEATKPVKTKSSDVKQAARLIGPATRLLLEKHKLSAADVSATGPRGALLKSDVLSHVAKHDIKAATPKSLEPLAEKPTTKVVEPVKPLKPDAAVAAEASRTGNGFTDVQLSNMRKTIAKRLTQSKQEAPHSYATVDCRIDSVLEMRKQLKADGVKVSVNDFVVKACAYALRAVPSVNVQWDAQSKGVKQMDAVDVSVAVATPAGLITPIVRDADVIGLQTISDTLKQERCRMSQELRRRVIALYKQLVFLGRDYPKGGHTYFIPKMKAVFLKHKDETDPQKIKQLIARGNYVCKELEALYKLRKYRAIKSKYYD